MTTTLNLTPRRLELLRAVRDGHVTCAREFGRRGHEPTVSSWNLPECRISVSADMDKLEAAGLVRKGAAEGPSMYSRRTWVLTDKGTAAIEEAS